MITLTTTVYLVVALSLSTIDLVGDEFEDFEEQGDGQQSGDAVPGWFVVY